MSGFNAKRDAAVADESYADRSLMCSANGCPNRWSVEAGKGKLCSAHAWAEPGEWPSITQQQQWDETERARNPPPPKTAPSFTLTKAEKLAILQRLRSLFRDKPEAPRGWAHELRQREQSGARLTAAQRDLWRSAIAVQPSQETTG